MEIEKRNHPVAVKWVIIKLDGKVVGDYGLVYPNVKEKK